MPNHTAPLTLLVSYAHPDDESFGLGGTIARYVDQGVDVHLICATNGEAGDVAPERLEGYVSKAALRLAELHCAAEKLGIKQVHTFGYRDSGMMGSADNDHPNSLWQADQTAVAAKVVEVIRKVRPQVVVTFDPHGGYGHPDHIAIHRATKQAFAESGDATQYPEQLSNGTQPFQAQRLYYTNFPRTLVRFSVAMARLRGQDPRRMGNNNDMDLQAVIEATIPSHARLDIRKYYEDWMAASACHASQQSLSTSSPLPKFIIRWLFGWQTFYREVPNANGRKITERDLFENVIS